MMILFTVIVSLIVILMIVQIFLYAQELNLEAQMSSIESGFEKNWYMNFLGSPFLFLAILFVLFDLELVLLLPFIFFLSFNSLGFIIIMTVIFLTLLVEWAISGLKWQV